ncbi:hypothetical protein ACFLZC_00520 [Patescibacteria group bacterium]
MKNLWILSEERPKHEVVKTIIKKFTSDKRVSCKIKDLKILPLVSDGCFLFKYEVTGFKCKKIEKIFIKLASGESSFVDFLLFYQKQEPRDDSVPSYAIEETKTSDTESRNTGVYQRCSKFVFIDYYYPKIKKIMLHNSLLQKNKKPTETNIFGTRMLLTDRVEIMGRKVDKNTKIFKNLEELIQAKNAMKAPFYGLPIRIKKQKNKIFISGRLYKSSGINHDPNIGALTMIAQNIRKWDKKSKIIITDHGLKQEHVGKRNKFILIANRLNIKLEGLTIPKTKEHKSYWHYETKQEKIGTIFVHMSILAFTKGKIIYENHGGCERGYFVGKSNLVAVKKYQDGKRRDYKSGNKTAIIYLPDIVVWDPVREEVVNAEGKTYLKRKNGIKELSNYNYFEKNLIKPEYNPKSIKRIVITFGGKKNKIREKKIGFHLNENGGIIIGKNTPKIITEAVNKLLSA